ncbi:hypothetical protein D477_003108 [Arthrobacter crystallopoietes BAB-32]|uniref:Transmembrane protein n=1 Tax=Arthrobacter crystallopoietes BAB-32 TaxID=1246476 RepID=N1V2S5_9MICC|nr:hypothetical protein [Arthrobacter crystallopoietes]EMY35650.1 hypothetical protein D477_003108 [Arthrobacter crystallopoietes BAB-32]
MPDGVLDPNKKSTRIISAVLAVLLGWLVVCYPAFLLALVSMFSFSGCFLECTEPDPLAGVLFLGAALVLAAAPVLLGWSILRPGSPAWKFGVGGLLVLAAIWGYEVVAGAL